MEEPRLITEEEIIRIIKNTGPDKILESDSVSNRILHIIAGVTPALIKRLFQACLDQGIQLDNFKSAITIILRKTNKENYTDPSSYRLIALFNTLRKALKAIILNYI